MQHPITPACGNLDPDSPMPLHAQAERWVRELIGREEYRNGALLPDEVSLAGRLGISRNTLREAIRRLVNEGLLERKAGIGTRVIEPKVRSSIGAWYSFSRDMERRGIRLETFVLKARAVKAPTAVVRALRLDPSMKILLLERIRGWAGERVVHFSSYLHPRLNLTSADDFSEPLYDLVEQKSGIVPVRSEEELTAISAPTGLASQLKVAPGTALLRRKRTVYDAGGRPMEHAIVHYRSDRFTFTLSLRKEEA